jgi:glutathione-independent formaldehyde dehydrogenase
MLSATKPAMIGSFKGRANASTRELSSRREFHRSPWGIIGVYLAPDPGARDKEPKQGIFPIGLAEVFDKALTIGSGQAPVKRYNEYLRDPIVNGRANPGKIVSHNISIEDVPGAYQRFDKRIDGYTKVLIHFRGPQTKAASA